MNIKQRAHSAFLCCIAVGCVFFAPATLSAQQPSAVLRPVDSTSDNVLGRGAATAGEGFRIQEIEQYTQITAAQKKKMGEIIDADNKSLAKLEASTHSKRISLAMACLAAQSAHDEAAAAKARKELLEIDQPIFNAMDKLTADLDNVLTPAQRKQFHEGRERSVINSCAAPVRLTDAQMNRAMAAYPKRDKGMDFEERMAQVVLRVLTDEEKRQVVKHHAAGYVTNVFGRAKLSDDQMKRVSAIEDELANDRHFDSDWPSHYSMEKELHKRVNSLLTAEQRAKVQGTN